MTLMTNALTSISNKHHWSKLSMNPNAKDLACRDNIRVKERKKGKVSQCREHDNKSLMTQPSTISSMKKNKI